MRRMIPVGYWQGQIDEAMLTGRFSPVALHNALNWETCAVGEVFGYRPSYKLALMASCSPIAREGMWFSWHVARNNIAAAQQIYTALQQRGREKGVYPQAVPLASPRPVAASRTRLAAPRINDPEPSHTEMAAW